MNRSNPLRHLAAAALVAGIAVTAAGCAGAPATTSTVAPPTTAPTVAATQSGPVAFAAWTERQGFGGSSGLNVIRKDAAWLLENRFAVDLYLLDDHGRDVGKLIAWLDTHEATACWSATHASIRTSLQTLADLFEQAHVERADGGAVEIATVNAIRDEAERAYAMAPPATCP